MFLRLGTWAVPSLSRRDVAGTGDVGERKKPINMHDASDSLHDSGGA